MWDACITIFMIFRYITKKKNVVLCHGYVGMTCRQSFGTEIKNSATYAEVAMQEQLEQTERNTQTMESFRILGGENGTIKKKMKGTKGCKKVVKAGRIFLFHSLSLYQCLPKYFSKTY